LSTPPNDTTLQVVDPGSTNVACHNEEKQFDRIPRAKYSDIGFSLTPLSAKSMFVILKYQSTITNRYPAPNGPDICSI
jgi:hypothetical protein